MAGIGQPQLLTDNTTAKVALSNGNQQIDMEVYKLLFRPRDAGNKAVPPSPDDSAFLDLKEQPRYFGASVKNVVPAFPAVVPDDIQRQKFNLQVVNSGLTVHQPREDDIKKPALNVYFLGERDTDETPVHKLYQPEGEITLQSSQDGEGMSKQPMNAKQPLNMGLDDTQLLKLIQQASFDVDPASPSTTCEVVQDVDPSYLGLGVEIRLEEQEETSGECNAAVSIQRDPVEQWVNRQPSAQFQEGRVAFCTEDVMAQMASSFRNLATGTHGALVSNRLVSSDEGLYEENTETGGQYDIVDYLGQGSFGEVTRCLDRTSKQEFIQKRVLKGFHPSEVLIPMNLNHPGIVRILGLVLRNGQQEILMEDAGTSLANLDKSIELTPTRIWDLMLQGLFALAYMDLHGIIHYDIKPENLCIQGGNIGPMTLKIADFGSAKSPQDPITFTGWTPEYMSTEACRHFLKCRFGATFPSVHLTGKTDVYSFAASVMYMFQRTHVLINLIMEGQGYNQPIPNNLRLRVIHSVAQDPNVMDMLIRDDWPEDFRQILRLMCVGLPEQRLTAAQAMMEMEVIEKAKQKAKAVQRQTVPSKAIRKPVQLITRAQIPTTAPGIPFTAQVIGPAITYSDVVFCSATPGIPIAQKQVLVPAAQSPDNIFFSVRTTPRLIATRVQDKRPYQPMDTSPAIPQHILKMETAKPKLDKTDGGQKTQLGPVRANSVRAKLRDKVMRQTAPYSPCSPRRASCTSTNTEELETAADGNVPNFNLF